MTPKFKFFILTLSLFLFTGCGGGGSSSSSGEDTDTTKPVITLTGDNPISLIKGASYTELGAKAEDDVDGTIDAIPSGTVDTSIVGTYTITYTATDSSDNNTTETRTVNVFQPNILLIISDDQGLDASAQYDHSDDVPNTPILNTLASQGVVFDNVWATPGCTTTRATIITGEYGIHSGVTYIPAKLDENATTIQKAISLDTESANYASAVFGKWHLGGIADDPDHPQSVGVDYYSGNLAGNVADYYDWNRTTNGVEEVVTEYHTTSITDSAIAWIGQQTTPWFTWLAYAAPHEPFHLPPIELFDSNTTLNGSVSDIRNNPRDYYFAAIEAMDTEIGRLLDSLSAEERAKTIVIYLGDNGTPARVIDNSAFIDQHSKGTLYEGGIKVPMVISGAGVSRSDEREEDLLHTTDLFATIAELTGSTIVSPDESKSFVPLLSSQDESVNETIYTEFESSDVTGWTIRDTIYKLISFVDGRYELYEVNTDLDESRDLLPSSNSVIDSKFDELKQKAEAIIVPLSYAIVDTAQSICYGSITGSEKTCDSIGYDADHNGQQPSYMVRSSGNIVTDNVTGLMWTQSSDIDGDGQTTDEGDQLTYDEAVAHCNDLTLDGYSDWRLPDIKTLYSLILFTGEDPSGYSGTETDGLVTFLDSNFTKAFGDQSAIPIQRIIDGQFASSTKYVSTTMNGDETMFGVNFIDGRIKGYPTSLGGTDKEYYVRCVRSNETYGQNSFTDNGDRTITDNATDLMWQKRDNESLNFEDAISKCETLSVGGYRNWRLPNVKELQSIVDYSRSPDTTGSAAIDSIFQATSFMNEENIEDWGYYWSSTTHAAYGGDGKSGAYVSFGRALGNMSGTILDVHGAGAQRSNAKQVIDTTDLETYSGTDASDGSTYYYKGPQGDILRVENMVRCVRDID